MSMLTNETQEIQLFGRDDNRKSIVKSSYGGSYVRPSFVYPQRYFKPENILSMRDYKKFKFINDITLKYTFAQVLGQGSFGVVSKCYLNDTNLAFAVKCIDKHQV